MYRSKVVGMKREYTLLLGDDRSSPLHMQRPVGKHELPEPGQKMVIGSKMYTVDRIVEDFQKEFKQEVPGLVNPVVVAYLQRRLE